MLLTTTNNIEGRQITAYYGIVSGETIIGMLMVTAAGTAVRYE